MGWHLRKPKPTELLLVIAIIVAVVATTLPATKWAASGHIALPVRVLVFDALRGRPIANARVGIFQASPPDDLKALDERPGEYAPKRQVLVDDSGTTSVGGAVVINHEFTTGANYERPTMQVHFRGVWVNVEAEGYGSIVVPVRYESQPVATLREQKEVLVSVGLMPMP